VVRSALLFFLILLSIALLAPPGGADENWPSFRGPNASGIAEGHPLPSSWSVESGEGILWSTPLPGLGHSSPVVWGNRIFLTTAISGKADPELRVGLYGNIASVEDDTEHRFVVMALDRKTGKIVWETTAHQGVPAVKRHTKASHANCTPATDGQHLVSFFGSEGLYCHDLEGKLLWKKDLGVLDAGFYMVKDAQWGFSSSPVLHDGLVIVQCDVQESSFLAALSLEDGSEVWRTRRDEIPTFSTPTVHVGEKRSQVIVNGYKHIGGYDLATGKELWKLVGGGDIPVPTPVVSGDHVFITNAHGRMAPVYAIRLDATGTVTDDGESKALSWVNTRGGAYMQTPLAYGNDLYSSTDNGVLTCYVKATGDRAYRERLGSGRTGFTASPVAGDGKIYFTSEEGTIFVVRAGEEFELLGTSDMGGICMATPAISEGVLFIRTTKGLVAVGAVEKG